MSLLISESALASRSRTQPSRCHDTRIVGQSKCIYVQRMYDSHSAKILSIAIYVSQLKLFAQALNGLLIVHLPGGVRQGEIDGHLECWPYICVYMSYVTWHDHAYVSLYFECANVCGSDRGYSGSVPGVYWANHNSSSWLSRDEPLHSFLY